jgi:hypothetical protein
LKQILETFKRIRIFPFFYADNFGWANQIINRRIIAVDGNDDRDSWIATLLGQACVDARTNVEKSFFECLDRCPCVNIAIWNVCVVTDRPDTPSSRERRVKWNGNFHSNPSRSIRYCGEFVRISNDSDQNPLNRVHSHLERGQNIQRVQVKLISNLAIKTLEICLAETMVTGMPI